MALRLAFAATALTLAAGFGASVLASCGSDAVGVQACREIEAARCEAAQSCPMNTIDLVQCKNFYHDECLQGIENTEVNDGGDPPNDQVNLCVNAIRQLEVCIKGGGKTMADCKKITLDTLIDPGVAAKTPCEVLETEAEGLAACAFIVAPNDGGVLDASDAGNDAFIL
jgi:hypothetical protein